MSVSMKCHREDTRQSLGPRFRLSSMLLFLEGNAGSERVCFTSLRVGFCTTRIIQPGPRPQRPFCWFSDHAAPDGSDGQCLWLCGLVFAPQPRWLRVSKPRTEGMEALTANPGPPTRVCTCFLEHRSSRFQKAQSYLDIVCN